MRKVLRNLKRILFKVSILTLIFLLVFIISVVPNYISPGEIEALVLTTTMLVGIYALLISGGLIAWDYSSGWECANAFWDWACSIGQEAQILENVNVDTNELTVTEGNLALAKQWIDENIDAEEYLQEIEIGTLISPWGTRVEFTRAPSGDYQPLRSISQELYDSAIKYETISPGGFSLNYSVYSEPYWKLYINGIIAPYYPPEWLKFYNIYSGIYNQIALERDCQGMSDNRTKFAFLLTEEFALYPVIIYRDYFGNYRTMGITYTQYPVDVIYPETKEVNVSIHMPTYISYPQALPDEINLPNHLAELIGISLSSVIAQDYADYWKTFPAGLSIVDLRAELLDIKTYARTIAEAYAQPLAVALATDLTIPETGIIDWDSLRIPMYGLTDKFPFSIPFDLFAVISNLQATPEAPIFYIEVGEEFGAAGEIELDFSKFENVAVVIRWTVLLGFVIGLIILTRKLIRG